MCDGGTPRPLCDVAACAWAVFSRLESPLLSYNLLLETGRRFQIWKAFRDFSEQPGISLDRKLDREFRGSNHIPLKCQGQSDERVRNAGYDSCYQLSFAARRLHIKWAQRPKAFQREHGDDKTEMIKHVITRIITDMKSRQNQPCFWS